MATAITLIDSAELSSTTASVTFSSIPSSYQHLQLTYSFSMSSAGLPYVRLNGDSTAWQYYNHRPYRSGGSISPDGSAGSYMPLLVTAVSTLVFTGELVLANYAQTDHYQTMIGSTGTRNRWTANAGYWHTTNAVSTILIDITTGSFNSGSVFSLYGLDS